MQGQANGAAQVKFHALPPEVKCPSCGGALAYIRVRKFGDLYQCARGAKACPGAVLHYCKAGTTRCGWTRVLEAKFPDRWIECADQALCADRSMD